MDADNSFTARNCALQDTDVKCTKTAEGASFRDLPPEIREQIFKMCIGWTEHRDPTVSGVLSNSPGPQHEHVPYGYETALIKALRPDAKLYGEALHVFCHENSFVLHLCNEWSFGLDDSNMMSTNAVSTIQKLRLDLQCLPDLSPGFILGEHLSLPTMNVRILDIACDTFNLEFRETEVSELLEHFILQFRLLEKVSIHLPEHVEWPTAGALDRDAGSGHFGADGPGSILVEELNELLGRPAMLATVDVLSLEMQMVRRTRYYKWTRSPRTWFWQAEEDTLLKPVKRWFCTTSFLGEENTIDKTE